MSSHYELLSNVDKVYLNSCPPAELLQGIQDSYHVSYDCLIFAEKEYHMASQFFVGRVRRYGRRCGLCETEAFQITEQVKKTSLYYLLIFIIVIGH